MSTPRYSEVFTESVSCQSSPLIRGSLVLGVFLMASRWCSVSGYLAHRTRPGLSFINNCTGDAGPALHTSLRHILHSAREVFPDIPRHVITYVPVWTVEKGNPFTQHLKRRVKLNIMETIKRKQWIWGDKVVLLYEGVLQSTGWPQERPPISLILIKSLIIVS